MKGTTATITSDQGTDVRVENFLSFRVQEDATPLDPNDSFGGVGQITFSLYDGQDTELFLGKALSVSGRQGKTSGVIETVTVTDGVTSISASSTLSKFNVEKTVPPFVGNFQNALQFYCDEVGITNNLVVDDSLASRSVVYPGWNGNVWVHLKQLLTKEKAEMALVFDTVTVRPVRERVATLERASDLSFSFDRVNPSRAIEIYYYNHRYGVQEEVYPVVGEDPTIFQVDAGETLTFTQQLNASLMSVNQPVPQDWVDNDTYVGTDGVYSIVGNDGLPIKAAQWIEQEGSLKVSITDDPSVIEITLKGAGMQEYAPYRIAMSSGANNHYNSLHITGEGVLWDKKTLKLPTGATQVSTSEEVGVVVDNPFVRSLSDAYTLGLITAGAFSGLNATMSGTALGVNRDSDTQAGISASLSDIDAHLGEDATIQDFNLLWAGSNLSDLASYYYSLIESLFDNQLFGNAVGARLLMEKRNYRIVSVDHELSGVTYFQAIEDTTIQDFNSQWQGDTIGDFNSRFANLSLRELSFSVLHDGGSNA